MGQHVAARSAMSRASLPAMQAAEGNAKCSLRSLGLSCADPRHAYPNAPWQVSDGVPAWKVRRVRRLLGQGSLRATVREAGA